MKIEINYDLTEKIQQAKGEAKLKRYTKTIMKVATPYIAIASILYPISIATGSIPLEDALKAMFNYCIAAPGLTLLCSPLIVKSQERLTGITEEQRAEKELNDLSLQLNSQFVKTSLPLLLDSKQYHKEHKLILNKKGLPCIMQNKYIMVPTYDDGDIKETSILQEHEIGSKKYVLSLGTPTKATQFKLAYGTGI